MLNKHRENIVHLDEGANLHGILVGRKENVNVKMLLFDFSCIIDENENKTIYP